MRKIILILLVLIILNPIYSRSEQIRRYAIVAGCNIGGDDTEELKYAYSDAKAFAGVLQQLGGFEESNIILLNNPEKVNLLDSFRKMIELVKSDEAESVQSEVVFYYSGHSNKLGLMLYDEVFTYEHLKNSIDDLPADVHVVVLDSCYSGSYTRYKGGERKPPFLFDSSNITEGKAVLTSSTGDESSQESDKYKSSFFSQALITGLRGPADSNGDNRVTLNEAYQYAYSDTLRKTESEGLITQHPAYDIQLKGTGNLILTDLHSPSAKLYFPENSAGLISIRDKEDMLVAEFLKASGAPLFLNIKDGNYSINIEQEGKKYSGSFYIDENTLLSYDNINLSGKRKLMGIFKGGNAKLDIFYPVGLNLKTKQNNTMLGINVLYGENHGFKGVLLGPFYTNNIGVGYGYQSGLLYNIQDGLGIGLQLTGGANISKESFKGVQVGSFNYAQDIYGSQFSLVNISEDSVIGLQAGAVNISGYNIGIQVGAVNKSKNIKGIQTGWINISNSINGLSLSAVNSTYDLGGVQIGIVNYAKRGEGLQVGLINISDEFYGLPIGIIDIQKNGENHFQVWTEFIDSKYFGFTGYRFGSRFLYKQFSIGVLVDKPEQSIEFGSLGFDLGVRIPLFDNRVSFLNDIGAEQRTRSEDEMDVELYQFLIPKFTNRLEVKLTKNLGLLAGVSTRLFFDNFNTYVKPETAFSFINPLKDCYIDYRFTFGIEMR